MTYSVSCKTDNKLLEDTQICLRGKKKLPGKRITGFQVVEFIFPFSFACYLICFQLWSSNLAGKRLIYNYFVLQFSPSDPSKVIVTSADSLVRVLCGPDVISKFKGGFLHSSFICFFGSVIRGLSC